MKPAVCIGCGCDEQHACPMDQVGLYAGCWWVRFDAEGRVGVCSACWDLARVWDSARKSTARRIEPILPLIAERFYRQVMFLYEDKASALSWLASPQQVLGGQSPRELILAGELDRVQTMLDQLREGAYI